MGKVYKVGIVGYGNLGKGAQKAINAASDMSLECIFTRRPNDVKLNANNVQVLPVSAAADMKEKLDAVLLCGGSATDLCEQGPYFAQYFNTVDTFDTHAKIPEYFASMQAAAKAAGHMSLISIGWDPGLFSLQRLMGEAILPSGDSYTFWGPGVSQGHSDAVRRIDGVANAKQYTMPIEKAIASVKNGENPVLSQRQRHTRVCYVVAKEGADKDKIEAEIKTMPNYFADYDTTVHFISKEEFAEKHSGMAHGGFALRSGTTSDGAKHIISYEVNLGSNPSFTSSVLTAYARACIRMAESGATGAGSILDVPPCLISEMSAEEQRQKLL